MLWRYEAIWLTCAVLGVASIVVLRHYKLPETVIFVWGAAVPIAAYLILGGYLQDRNRN
jgi:Na+-translocating ferredoxin:NAD+ oxidoreductase RnfA subunit